MKTCENCKYWDKQNAISKIAAENRFLHIIAINDRTESIAVCKEIVYHSVDGFYEIGFGNNFGCRRYIKKDED